MIDTQIMDAHMKKKRRFLVLLVTCLPILCMNFLVSAENVTVGKVLSRDSAQMSLDGIVWSRIDRTMPITSGTMLRTSEEKLFISFNDNVRIQLGKTSELVIKKSSKKGHVIELKNGGLLYTVPPCSGLTIITSDSVVKIEKDDPLRFVQKNRVGSIVIQNNRTYVKSFVGNVKVDYHKKRKVVSHVSRKDVSSPQPVFKQEIDPLNVDDIYLHDRTDDGVRIREKEDRADKKNSNNRTEGTDSIDIIELDDTAGFDDEGGTGASPFIP